MTRMHRPVSQQGCLTLTLASNGTDKHTYQDKLSTLTTLQQDERCHDCAWPTICAHDRTCWHQEHDADWQRSRIDLPAHDSGGRNTWTRPLIEQAIRDFHKRHGRPPGREDFRASPHLPGIHRIHKEYGTVNQAQDAAGVPRTRGGWQRKRKPQPQVQLAQPQDEI